MKKPNSYQEARDELDEILDNLQNHDPNIDELSKYVKRASELIKFCKEKLRATDNEITDIFEED